MLLDSVICAEGPRQKKILSNSCFRIYCAVLAILNVFVKLRLSIQLLLQNLKTMTQKQTHNNLTSNLSYTTARPQLGQSGGQSQLYHEGLAKVDEGKVQINGEYVRLS